MLEIKKMLYECNSKVKSVIVFKLNLHAFSSTKNNCIVHIALVSALPGL